MVTPRDASGERPKTRYRDRHRAARRREFLDTARRIVTTEGLPALTMQRVTEELDSSSGGIYVYFKTKDILIAEMQRDALATLGASFLEGQDRLAAFLRERGVEEHDAALVHVLGAGRFWVDSEESLPIDIELSRRLFASAETTTDSPQVAEVLPTALTLLAAGRACLERGVEAGVLEPGSSVQRFILLISCVTGALLTSKLGTWDDELFDGRLLATQLVHDLMRGWGADVERIESAEALLGAFVEQGQIAPPVSSVAGPG